jgi:hypothetical protein
MIQGFEFLVSGIGFRIKSSGFSSTVRVWNLECGVAVQRISLFATLELGFLRGVCVFRRFSQ